jgi:hypothetical protein
MHDPVNSRVAKENRRHLTVSKQTEIDLDQLIEV